MYNAIIEELEELIELTIKELDGLLPIYESKSKRESLKERINAFSEAIDIVNDYQTVCEYERNKKEEKYPLVGITRNGAKDESTQKLL